MVKNKGLLNIGDTKELKVIVKDYVDNIFTLAVVQLFTKEDSDALYVPLVVDDTEASI